MYDCVPVTVDAIRVPSNALETPKSVDVIINFKDHLKTCNMKRRNCFQANKSNQNIISLNYQMNLCFIFNKIPLDLDVQFLNYEDMKDQIECLLTPKEFELQKTKKT